jgi:hypothetical protein
MFSLSLNVPFDDVATPPKIGFAFSQLLELFQGQNSKAEVLPELFWASLYGIAELTRTKRFTSSRQKERVRALVELFSFRKRRNGTGRESAMNVIGALSSFREPGEMSPHRRSCIAWSGQLPGGQSGGNS